MLMGYLHTGVTGIVFVHQTDRMFYGTKCGRTRSVVGCVVWLGQQGKSPKVPVIWTGMSLGKVH